MHAQIYEIKIFAVPLLVSFNNYYSGILEKTIVEYSNFMEEVKVKFG